MTTGERRRGSNARPPCGEAIELAPGKTVGVRTCGHLDRLWRAELSPKDDGTHVKLTWVVTVERPILAAAEAGLRVEPPVDDATR